MPKNKTLSPDCRLLLANILREYRTALKDCKDNGRNGSCYEDRRITRVITLREILKKQAVVD